MIFNRILGTTWLPTQMICLQWCGISVEPVTLYWWADKKRIMYQYTTNSSGFEFKSFFSKAITLPRLWSPVCFMIYPIAGCKRGGFQYKFYIISNILKSTNYLLKNF